MKLKSCVLIFCVLSLFFGCASNKEVPNNEPDKLDYSIEEIKQAEIKRINEMLEKKPVLALWRATLVNDESTINLCFENVRGLYDKAISEKDYFTALRLFQSLEAAKYPKISELNTNFGELSDLSKAEVPGLSNPSENFKTSSAKRDFPENVEQYIQGTVTIWVDQGIKVENGMGFADRVIGSGFFIRNDGYLVTNHHVIKNVVDTKFEGVAKLYIRLADDPDTRIPAKVVGYDELFDLALLKAEIDAPYVFNLGSSSDLSVGDRIYAIGSPVGLDRTLTSGIVSAKNRKLFSTANVFQIDAAVNGGNSGGPCIDVNGNVQAVVFAGVAQAQGLNFAIPVEYLKIDLPILFKGGKREHVWLGGFGHTIRSGSIYKGVGVEYVMSSGVAKRAGLTTDCIITGVNGVDVKTLDQFQDILAEFVPETLITLNYSDSEENEKSVLVYLESRPEKPGKAVYQHDLKETSFVPLFGMALKPVSTESSKKYAISKIIKGGIADESGFSENDPVEIGKVEFGENDSYLGVQIFARKRKKGYLDVGVSMVTSLDSPYYF